MTPQPDDHVALARRLDQVIGAHSGDDPLAEALKVMVAKLHAERAGVTFEPRSAADLDALLAGAAWRWPAVLAEPETRLTDVAVQNVTATLWGARIGDGGLAGINALFQAMVGRSARGERGQFFTPSALVSALVGRMALRPGESVVDPACGSGGFLVRALEAEPTCDVWAFDNDRRAVAVARAMLVIAGACPTHVQRADALGVGEVEAAVGAPFAGFDVVLTNPPFGGEVGEEAGATYGIARGPRNERDVLFLERCLQLLRPGGRFAIIVPDRQCAALRLATVRAWLLCHAELTDVIGLSRGTFLPYTSQRACVYIGRRRLVRLTTPEPDEVVRFELADGRSRARVGVRVRDLARGLILAPERYLAHRAASLEVAGATDVDRNAAPRAPRTVDECALVDLASVGADAHRPGSLPPDRPLLVLDVGHAWEGLVLATHSPIQTTMIRSPKRLVQEGDVVISRLRTYLRQVAYVDASLFERVSGGNGVAVSAEFMVIRGRGGFSAAGLVPWLLSEAVQAQLSASEEGGHHPRFRKEVLEQLRVPAEVVQEAGRVAGNVLAAAAKVAEGFALLRPSGRPAGP